MEACKNPITHFLKPFTSVFLDQGSLKITVLTEKMERFTLITAHQRGVSDDVCEHYRC
jgi:hypothetical protein